MTALQFNTEDLSTETEASQIIMYSSDRQNTDYAALLAMHPRKV